MDSSGEATATARLSPVASSTSSYFLQLDPNSGRIEIVDSSMIQSTGRTVELGGGGGDESVYEIREEDNYYLSSQQFMDQDHGLPDIEPVVGLSDILEKPLQSYLPEESFEAAGNSLDNLIRSFPGYEEITSAERDTVQQAIDEAYESGSIPSIPVVPTSTNVSMGDSSKNIILNSSPQFTSSSANNAVTATSQVQITDQTQQTMQIPVTLQNNVTCDTEKASPTTKAYLVPSSINLEPKPSVLSELIPLPSQPNSLVATAVAPAPVNFVAIPNHNQIDKKAQREEIALKENEIRNIAKQIMESKMGVENKIHQSVVHSQPQSITGLCIPNATSQKATVVVSNNNIDVDMKSVDENYHDVDFIIKIESCYSLSQVNEEHVNQNETNKSTEINLSEKSNEEIVANEESESKKNGAENKQEDEIEPVVTERVPLLPEWLLGHVDEDDELLIAFKNRPDPMLTAICAFCYSWFYDKKELDEHVLNDHAKKKPRTHSCRICGSKFIARILRIRHEKNHRYDLKHPWYKYVAMVRDKNPFKLPIKTHFTRRFRPAPFAPSYYNHLQEVFNEIQNLPYQCVSCEMEFSEEETLRDHYDQFHALQTCSHCNKILNNWQDLQQHEKDFHGHYEITKNYVGGAWHLWSHWRCDESLEKEDKISDVAFFHNYRKISPDEPIIYKEEFIENTPEVSKTQDIKPEPRVKTKGVKRRATTTSDTSEVITKLKEIEETPPPPETKIEAPQEPSIAENDNVSVHGDENEDITFVNNLQLKNGSASSDLAFKCDACVKSYDNEHDLKRHQRCHQGEKQTLACQFCGKLFKTHSHKKEHERTHTGEKPYICPICNRSFIQSSNLKKHIQTHKSQNTLQCGTCGKQFIKEASLVLHQRAHAQDRKFRCDVCDRAYNYASLLKRHMRIHTGEMPYVCDLCGMLFHELVSLHYHRKKVHTGERPHKCETCGRAFILSSDLKKHMQIHQKLNIERPVSKVSRRRSQSKSLENDAAGNDCTRETGSIGDDEEQSSGDKTLSTVSEVEEMEVDAEGEVLKENSTNPNDTSETPIVQKPPLRVYQRRDTKQLEDQRVKSDDNPNSHNEKLQQNCTSNNAVKQNSNNGEADKPSYPDTADTNTKTTDLPETADTNTKTIDLPETDKVAQPPCPTTVDLPSINKVDPPPPPGPTTVDSQHVNKVDQPPLATDEKSCNSKTMKLNSELLAKEVTKAKSPVSTNNTESTALKESSSIIVNEIPNSTVTVINQQITNAEKHNSFPLPQLNLETLQLLNVGNSQQSHLITLPFQPSVAENPSRSIPLQLLQSSGVAFQTQNLKIPHQSNTAAVQQARFVVLQPTPTEINRPTNLVKLQQPNVTFLPQVTLKSVPNFSTITLPSSIGGTTHNENSSVPQTLCFQVPQEPNSRNSQSRINNQAGLPVLRPQETMTQTSTLYGQNRIPQLENNSTTLQDQVDETIPFMEVDSFAYGGLDFSNMIVVAPDACEEVVVDENQLDASTS